MTTVVLFRDDLRVTDHPALHEAVSHGEPVVCLYVLDQESEGVRPLGGAAKWWLHHSLSSLAADLSELGVPLTLRRGPAGEVVPGVVRETGADRLLWNRRYGGPERAVDAGLKEWAGENGVDAHSYAGSLMFEPWTVSTQNGDPYRVFTPFWRACTSGPPPREPYPAPSSIDPADPAPASDDLANWGLLPTHPDWSGGLARTWTVGERAAHERLDDFLDERLPRYAQDRDVPAKPATSGLSPHLRWGEISPYTVWHTALERAENPGKFLTEVGWREFSWYNLYVHPDMATENINPKFDAFPWPPLDEDVLAAWQMGRRDPAGGRRDARAVGDRDHAEPRAHGGGLPAGQEPADRLAPGRAVVLGHPGGRGPREQSAQLAVGGRLRHGRRALLPDLQRRDAAEEVRP